jgi:hypothetical protein
MTRFSKQGGFSNSITTRYAICLMLRRFAIVLVTAQSPQALLVKLLFVKYGIYFQEVYQSHRRIDTDYLHKLSNKVMKILTSEQVLRDNNAYSESSVTMYDLGSRFCIASYL